MFPARWAGSFFNSSAVFTAMAIQFPLQSTLLGFGIGIVLTHSPAAHGQIAKASIQIQQTGNTRTAVMTVPVSQAHAWTVLTDYVTSGEAMPDISKVQLLSRQGNLIRIRQTYQAPYTFGLTISATLAVKETPKTSISFRMLEGDRIRKLNGSWTFAPTANGTRIKHTVTLVPDLPDVLQPVFAELTRNSMHETMQRVSGLMQAKKSERQKPITR